MKRDKFLKIRMDEESLARIRALARESGAKTVSAYVCSRIFSGEASPNKVDYIGWAIVDNRRVDWGIKISREPAPVGMKSPVILYPEDKSYPRYL